MIIDVHAKRIDIPLLNAALGSIAPNGVVIRDGFLYHNDNVLPPNELPPSAVPIVNAHVAPPRPTDYIFDQSISGVVRTTDATPTEIYRLTLLPLTGYTGTVVLIGVDTGNGAVRVIRASFAVKRLNGGAVAVGAPVVMASHTDAQASTWAITPSVSGNDALLTVTGAAGRTIDFSLAGTMTSFTPAGR